MHPNILLCYWRQTYKAFKIITKHFYFQYMNLLEHRASVTCKLIFIITKSASNAAIPTEHNISHALISCFVKLFVCTSSSLRQIDRQRPISPLDKWSAHIRWWEHRLICVHVRIHSSVYVTRTILLQRLAMHTLVIPEKVSTINITAHILTQTSSILTAWRIRVCIMPIASSLFKPICKGNVFFL